MLNDFHEMLAHAPIGIVYTKQRMIMSCNNQFCEMFGYEEDELVGQSMAILYASTDEYQKIGQIWDKVLRKSGYHDDVRIMKRKNGNLFWVRGRGKSLTPDEPFLSGVWTYEDLSIHKSVIEVSPRERQVCMLLIEGRSAKDIARKLDISPRTAEAHRANLMKKYGTKTTGELIARLATTPM